MTEFMRSYTPAMRSNMARTWGSGSVPGVDSATGSETSVSEWPGGEDGLAVIVPDLTGLLEHR